MKHLIFKQAIAILRMLTWTGRGRQPKWIVKFLANGGTLEQLSV